MPTAAKGTLCTSHCTDFNGSMWCCTQADGCPNGGNQSESWGWCSHSCFGNENIPDKIF